MPPLKPSSAKAKGRRHQQRIVRDILDAFPHLTPDDVRSTSMGAGGEDVLLSPAAQRCVPLSIEAKNCERLNVWAALAQCEANAPPGRPPCVVFTRNRANAYAAVPWEWVLSRLAPATPPPGEGSGSLAADGAANVNDNEGGSTDLKGAREGDSEAREDVVRRHLAEALVALSRAGDALGAGKK